MEGNEHNCSVEELIDKGITYYYQENYQKSKEIFKRALGIQSKEFGDDDLSVASTLLLIGKVLMTERKSDEALEKLNRALAIRMKKLGRHDDTAEAFAEIGSLLLSQDDDKKAEPMFRKALDIKREIQPKNHYDEAHLCQLLADSLRKQGKYSEATKVLKFQLATLLQVHGEDHPGVILAYQGIAKLLSLQNRLGDALQIIDRGIEICKRLQRLGDFEIRFLGGTFQCKGHILCEQGNFKAATEAFNKVLLIQKETIGEMHHSTAQTYEYLALTYDGQDMIEDAIQSYAKAISISRKVPCNHHPHTEELVRSLDLLEREKNASSLNEQGLAMRAKGNSEMAIQLFQESLDIYRKISITNPNVAAVYEHISSIKVDQGLLEDAIAASAEALKIRRRADGDDNADTKRRMEEHRSLLRRLVANRS
ncbi:unnamed protein product [Cylindrotheca closterium]|uniref:MalT-like TPR region domain-containing protein n=1 Tax=Cylindrotheca closterium TaxID=2856 RepID=A0AAD2JGV5_9STRA|nr:unnamed protein product [Cylindrotheca closterium]